MKEKLAELKKRYGTVVLLGEGCGWSVSTKDGNWATVRLTDVYHEKPEDAVEEAFDTSRGCLVVHTNS